MKKTSAIMAVTFVILIITAMALTPVKGISQKEIKILNSNSIPDSLNKILVNSCAYCHSDEGKFIAKAKLNFSGWDKYTQKEKIKKGNAICKMISEGAMPPKSARKSKPEAIPTDAQIKNICNWSVSLSLEK